MAKTKGKVTQKTMVETALAEKGWDASPLDLQAAIKEKFGVEMPTNYISNYKSQLKSAGAKPKGKPGRKPKAGVQFSDLQEVQGLVTRLGAVQVKKLIEVAEMFD